MAQVKIGPDFFQNAKKDYANWRWALAREFMQNSVDCGSTEIRVAVQRVGEDTELTITNNGEPMSQDVMVDKLLSLGSSGKRFNGSVGGFGKAKELLYFCWKRYSIHSGTHIVEGCGAEYTIRRAKDVEGTVSTVLIPGDEVHDLRSYFRLFTAMSNIKTCVWVDDQLVDDRLHLGHFRRALPFGRVYTNKQLVNALVVRISGTPMFTSYTRYSGCVVLELSGASADNLTANRDGLLSTQRSQVEQFLADLMVNKSKALHEHRTEYTLYPGAKLKVSGFQKRAAQLAAKPQSEAVLHAARAEAFEPAPIVLQVELAASYAQLDTREYGASVQDAMVAKEMRIASNFVIKNETGNVVKPGFRPDSDRFSPYAYRMLMMWTRVLLELHRIFEIEGDFSVGFLFTKEDIIAQHEYSHEYGRVYFINPVIVDGCNWTKRFQTSFNKARGDLNQIIITALHEIVHGIGYSDHDEAYANKVTDMAGQILGHTRELVNAIRPSPTAVES